MHLRSLGAVALTLMATQSFGVDLVSENFDTTDPTARGWTLTGGSASDWTTSEYVSPGRSVHAGLNVTWQSPQFNVTPYNYYQLAFDSLSQGKEYWNARYFNSGGGEFVSDTYASIMPSATWKNNSAVFRGRPGATASSLGNTTASVSFAETNVGDGLNSTYIDNVQVSAVTHAQVAALSDTLYATMPKVISYTPPANKFQNIPKFIQKLQTGQTVRVVMLGDSIINDTNNSSFETLVERKYPGAKIEVVPSVRGSTGMTYYKDNNRVTSYVTDYQPDLVMLGGISNFSVGASVASVMSDFTSVMDQIRSIMGANAPEMMLMSDTVFLADNNTDPVAYRAALSNLAGTKNAAYVDMRAPWDNYMTNLPSGWTVDMFHRDDIHANDYGKQILGRTLENFFTPVPEPTSVTIIGGVMLASLLRRRRHAD